MRENFSAPDELRILLGIWPSLLKLIDLTNHLPFIAIKMKRISHSMWEIIFGKPILKDQILYESMHTI